MVDFTPEETIAEPSAATLQRMAEALNMVPAGTDIPHEWLSVLRRQFIAAHQVVAVEPRTDIEAWKWDYGVNRLQRAGEEYLSIRIAGRTHDILRKHAVYLHGLMAHVLAPMRTRAEDQHG